MNAAATQHDDHSAPDANVWLTSFSDEDRQEQMAEDSLAWNRVTGLLLTVVAIGLVMAAFAVALTGS